MLTIKMRNGLKGISMKNRIERLSGLTLSLIIFGVVTYLILTWFGWKLYVIFLLFGWANSIQQNNKTP